MRYFQQYKKPDATEFEITKEQARHILEGNWKEEMLEDIFENEKSFRLFTMFSKIWTMDENGLVPVPGFYGVCE